MRIKKIIKKGKIYEIVLENNEIIKTYDDVLIKYKIYNKKEINNEKYLNIKLETKYYSDYYNVIKFINKRLRSEYEIKEYMNKIDINDNNQLLILKKLRNLNLINDEIFMNAYIHDRLTLSNDGPIKIYNYLIKHQIDRNEIEKNINKQKNLFLEKLKKIIIKKSKNNRKYSKKIFKQKIIYYLLNLGYDYNDIKENLEYIELMENKKTE